MNSWALAARAADMAAAAGEAQEAARAAADDLARQTLRLENAGAGVAEQIQSVEEGLGQQRAALVTAAYSLRTDQEDFSAQVESQRAQLTEQLSVVRSTSTELVETTATGTDALRDLVEAAADQFRALIEMSQREADNFDSATKVSLDRFEALSADARDTLLEQVQAAGLAPPTFKEFSESLGQSRDGLAALLASPRWRATLVLHANHPREISPALAERCRALGRGGGNGRDHRLGPGRPE